MRVRRCQSKSEIIESSICSTAATGDRLWVILVVFGRVFQYRSTCNISNTLVGGAWSTRGNAPVLLTVFSRIFQASSCQFFAAKFPASTQLLALSHHPTRV